MGGCQQDDVEVGRLQASQLGRQVGVVVAGGQQREVRSELPGIGQRVLRVGSAPRMSSRVMPPVWANTDAVASPGS